MAAARRREWVEGLADSSRRSRTPPRSALTPAERGVVDACSTPARVQAWLRALPYNWELEGRTLRTFRGVVRHRTANCMEAVLASAAILEQHGHAPTILDLESQDGLDHVLHLYQAGGRWGSIGKSRDEGLHGRKPHFRSVRDLVYSYVDPYVDGAGRITRWGVFDLDELTRADWRLGRGDVGSVEKALIAAPHHALATSERRYERTLGRYLAFKRRHPDRAPDFYGGRDRWL